MTNKKITLATFKKFIRDNQSKLYLKVKDDFDPMQDMVTSVEDNFSPITPTDRCIGNNLGITGLWLVGQSRDWFTPYQDDKYQGIEYSNCCGSGLLVTNLI